MSAFAFAGEHMQRQVLDHPGFRRRRLEAQAGGPGIGVKIFVDGVAVAPERNVWKVVDDSGTTHEVKPTSGALSLSTTLSVGTASFTLPAPLSVVEYVLAGLPLALITVGGGIGGALGAGAAALNMRLLTSSQPAAVRYLGALATTGLAVGLWLAAATAISSARN
jgi:hypothetical protein